MLIFNDIYEMNKISRKHNRTNTNLAPPKKETKLKKNSLDTKNSNNKLNKNKKKKYIAKNIEEIFL